MACLHKDTEAEEGSASAFVQAEPPVTVEADQVQRESVTSESDDEDDYDKSSEELASCRPALEDLWPLLKLHQHLQALSKTQPTLQERQLAVLLTTGAMNPMHYGHAQLMHQAVARLHKEGFDVVGAWLSPSHDGYVQPKARKMNTIGFSSQFRLEAARRAVAEDSLLAVGSWEAKKPGRWPDYPEVAMALQRKLRKVEKAWNLSNGFKVFYACGTDHAKSQGLYRGFLTDRGFGVVIVPREGEQAKSEEPERRVFVAQSINGEGASYNSTMIRSALRSQKKSVVTRTLPCQAADFLLRPTDQDYSDFREDYDKLGP